MIAHELGLKVVAKGIEDKPAWDLLQTLGCDTPRATSSVGR
jgi:EAL domain-containing protein (putative c-di-GMP-specific phosphodiesterase class I)